MSELTEGPHATVLRVRAALAVLGGVDSGTPGDDIEALRGA